MRVPWKLVAVLLLFSVVGFLLFADYGESWDEATFREYSQWTLNTYLHWTPPSSPTESLGLYGGFHGAVIEAGAAGLEVLLRGFSPVEIRHLIYFLILVWVAGPSLWYLMRRFLAETPSLLGLLLFFGQPLLFGHAFINPKDTPFLAFFCASMAIGLAAVDAFSGGPTSVPGPSLSWRNRLRTLLGQSREDWTRVPLLGRVLIGVVAVAGIIGAILLAGYPKELVDGLQSWITRAYLAPSSDILHQAFRSLAQRSAELPLDAYLDKAARSVEMWRRPAAASIAAIGLIPAVYAWRATARLVMPPRPWLLLLAAGAAMGITTSIRLQGILGGILICALLFRRRGLGGLGLVAAYALAGAGACIMAWPYLWEHPLQRFAGALPVLLTFNRDNQLLYFGEIYGTARLPWHYPFFFSVVQLTEPVWPLAILGVGSLLWMRRGGADRGRGDEIAMLVAWYVVPTAGASLTHSPLYDNARQLLFVLPAILLLAAIGMERVRAWPRHRWAGWALTAAVLYPGLAGLVRLHPYQYVYFNSLVGGVRGAWRRFETDYWATSYREATEFINANASPNAAVYVLPPIHLFVAYAREDLKLFQYGTPMAVVYREAEFGLATSRLYDDLELLHSGQTVYRVEVDGATLAIVRRTP